MKKIVMNSMSMEEKKRCEKCFEYVKIYITCFKCDLAYHIHCWKKVPGAYVNQSGQLLCCRDLTSNYAGNHINLGTQDNPPERVIEKGSVDSYNKGLKNSLIKEEDSKWDEFKCDASLLEFTNKEHLENHYSECSNKGGEFIQELKEDDEDLENNLIKEEDSKWNEFKCDASSLKFMNKEYLENHYNECPNKERGLIQELKEDKDLENCLHKEEDLDWDDFKCYACSSEFANEEHLKAHYKESCNEEGALIQDFNEDQADLFCSFRYEENFQKESYKQPTGRCNVESSFSTLNNDTCVIDMKRDPAQGNDTEKKYKCAHCKYSTCYKMMLVRHERVHTKKIPLKCDMCGYAAAQKDQLKKHTLTKHSNAEKKYKCTDCNYSSHDKTSLVNHKRTHTNERPFKCDTCEYAAAREGGLKRHILTKHSNAEKKYKCSDCIYSTHDKPSLVNHKRFHTNERPFKCYTCEYAAAQKGQLKRHILTNHSNVEKKYKCGDCKYSSHDKRSLVQHERTHTNERPFKCDTCEYAASQKGDLNIHIITKHSNAEKRYKCGHCEYSTHIKRSLLIHEHTHTKEKPYKCDMCDYAAANNGNLRRHILGKHSNLEKHTSVGIVNSQL